MFNITVVNEHTKTDIYGDCSSSLDTWKRRRGTKETEEGKVSDIKSKGHIRGRNRFLIEFISGLGEGFILISNIFSNRA